MRISRGIYDDTVKILVRSLNGINYLALVIRLKENYFVSKLQSGHADKILESGKGLRAVYVRLSDTEHIEVRTVYN
jgi:hypothetical protein